MLPKPLASEFPHDNPELSDGVTWLCPSVCARPLPCAPGVLLRPASSPGLRQARTPTPPITRTPAPPITRVRSVASVAATAAEPLSAFQRFVQAMARVALAEGATLLAAELPSLLAEARLRPSALSESAQRALRGRGYLSADGGAASPRFVHIASAWRGVLEGSSADIAACGDKTLDEWGSDLLSALLGRAPSSGEDLRRALRRAGVAAFGVRDAA